MIMRTEKGRRSIRQRAIGFVRWGRQWVRGINRQNDHFIRGISIAAGRIYSSKPSLNEYSLW
jgi:hypothetical protein